MNATKQQVQAINAILAKTKQMAYKAEIIEGVTLGRTTHSKELTYSEASGLLKALTKDMGVKPSQRMINKLFAMANEINYIPTITQVTEKGIEKKKDYSRLHAWVLKYGSLKKPLREYSDRELPGLVTQFELGPYNSYIAK